MSRSYRVEVCTTGITFEQLRATMANRFGWEELDLSEYRGIASFTGEGRLTGGQSEEEAHEEIYKALKAMNAAALISTRWTYLEELPYSIYGDKFDVESIESGALSDNMKGGTGN